MSECFAIFIHVFFLIHLEHLNKNFIHIYTVTFFICVCNLYQPGINLGASLIHIILEEHSSLYFFRLLLLVLGRGYLQTFHAMLRYQGKINIPPIRHKMKFLKKKSIRMVQRLERANE